MDKEETKRIFAGNLKDHALFGILDVCRIIRSYLVTPFLEFVKSEPIPDSNIRFPKDIKLSFCNDKFLIISWFPWRDQLTYVKFVDLQDLFKLKKIIDPNPNGDYPCLSFRTIDPSNVKVYNDRVYLNVSNHPYHTFGYAEIKTKLEWVEIDYTRFKADFILIDEKNQSIYFLNRNGCLNVYELKSCSFISDHNLGLRVFFDDVQLCTKSNQLIISMGEKIICYEIRVSGGKFKFHRNYSFSALTLNGSMCVDDGLVVTVSHNNDMVLRYVKGAKIKKLKSHSSTISSMALSVKLGLFVTVDSQNISIYKTNWRVF
jgi:hypothetical protein